MRSDELVTAFYLTTFFDTFDTDFTAARIRQECSDTLHTVFEQPIVNSRQGYWLKTSLTTTVAGRANYRIPARAVVGGLEKLELAGSDGQYSKLIEVTPQRAVQYEGGTGETASPPAHYYVQGDTIRLLPAPASADYTIRFSYYLRPSRLVAQQSSTLDGSTVRGLITAIDTSARTLTVNAIPFDQELGTPAAITTAVQLIDVVHPDGWFELALVGAAQTLSGSTITVGGTADMSEIAVGDYVRSAEQTDWPCLPVDYHRTLVNAAAMRALKAKHMTAKADAIAEEVAGDLKRLADLLQPRIKNSPRVLKPQYGVIWGGARRSW